MESSILVLILISLAGLTIRLYPAFLRPPDLVRYVADDAFYYFKISRNIAAGEGATFDGLNRTNGFHPMYAALLVFLYKWFPEGDDSPIRIALILLALFNVATCWIAYAFVQSLAGPWAALFAAAIWLFNPGVVFTATQGTEAALWVFFGALSAYIWLSFRLMGPDDVVTSNLLLGLVVGLAFLARSEAILLFIAIGLDMFLSGPEGIHVPNLSQIAPYAIGAGIVVAPWIAWNWLKFGRLTQISGDIIAYHRHQSATMGASGFRRSIIYVQYAVRNSIFAFMRLADLVLADRIVTGLFAGVTLGAILANQTLSLASLPTGEVAVLAMFTTLAILFYGAWLWNFQDWYFLFACFAGTIFAGVGIGLLQVSLQLPDSRFLAIVASLLVLVLFALDIRTAMRGKFNHQSTMYEGARWLSINTDPDARIGSFNSGIIGYYSDRTVVNLDGVVNNEAAAAIRINQLLRHIRQMNIEYVVDFDIGIQRYRPFMGGTIEDSLELIHEFRGSWHGTNFMIYKMALEERA